MPRVIRLPALTPRLAAWGAAAVAASVYAAALWNGWAGDDPLVVQGNVRAHSIGAALAAWFKPYWPPPWEGAGLHRPLTILSYAVDWTIAGGRPWMFHLNNVLLHAVGTAFAVLTIQRWLPPLGALVAGVLFAVHPVHVEAVANVVGRAELLAAVALFGALLAARRFRHAADGRTARRWAALTLLAVAGGLFAKEQAAVAIAVIALDHALDPRPGVRPSGRLYVALAALTIGWFHVWRAVAGVYVGTGATSAFYGLSSEQRIATMLPVVFDVLRLLAWPLELASDYSQMTIPVRTDWSGLAAAGAAVGVAYVLLGLRLARVAPAVAFGLLLAAGTYLPTSNLLFTSGVVLSERALYLAVLAPAACAGWAVVAVGARPYRRLGWAALGLLGLLFAVKTVQRVPYWSTPTNTIVEDAAEHPENYRARLHLASLFASRGDTARALAEYLSAAALAPNDPFLTEYTTRSAITLGRPGLAISEGRRARAIAPDDPRPVAWLASAYLAAGRGDSAVALAQAAALAHPHSPGFMTAYDGALREAGSPAWRPLMARATADWIEGLLVAAAARLDSLKTWLPTAARAPGFCRDLELVRRAAALLSPETLVAAEDWARRAGRPCPTPGAAQKTGAPAN